MKRFLTLTLLALSPMLLLCCNRLTEIELIVVSKTPRGAYAEGNDPDYLQGIGWYEIGLSRNGKEPVEYIWRTAQDTYNRAIIDSEIGEKGILRRSEFGKQKRFKLPLPNANNPPIIGVFGEARWDKAEPVSNGLFIELDYAKGSETNYEWDYVIFNGRKYTVINPYTLWDIETFEEIDLRTVEDTKNNQ